MKNVFNQNSLWLWLLLSLGIHLAALAWCPAQGSFRPPYPVYLVVDLFSGPVTSGTGHGLTDDSGGGSKSAPSTTLPPKESLQKSPPAAPKHPLPFEPVVSQSPPLTKPVSVDKPSKQEPVPMEQVDNTTPPKESPEAEVGAQTTTASDFAIRADPLTDHQNNIGRHPAEIAGSGSSTASGPGSGHGGQAGSGSPVETPFAYGSNPPPPYPSTARRRGWEGKVLLLVEVSAVGEVCKITVSHSSGYGILDRAAINAVYRWRFQAALRNGRAVAGKVMVPIQFSIKDAK